MKISSLKCGALVLGLLCGGMTVQSHAAAMKVQATPFQSHSVAWVTDGVEYRDGQNKVFNGEALVDKGHREIANGFVYKGQDHIAQGEQMIQRGQNEMADAQSYGPAYVPDPVVVVPEPHIYVREYIGHPWHWHHHW